MASGGARTQSGPAADPKSGRSESRGYVLVSLPSEGFKGRPPGLNQFLPKPTTRHREVWAELWSTPQACRWIQDRWRWPTVADLTRRMVQVEDPGSPVSVGTQVRQLRDDLGLSAAGLNHNGWAIVRDQVAERREQTDEAATVEQPKRGRRLRDASA